MQARIRILILLVVYLLLLLAGAWFISSRPARGAGEGSGAAGGAAELGTAQAFAALRAQPGRLLAFLRLMPKGGDLHSHLSGAVYAETLIESAARSEGCINPKTLAAVEKTKCGPDTQAAAALTRPDMSRDDIPLYRATVDAWSMRNWEQSGRSGHDQFFDTFAKFGKATDRTGDMLAEVRARAADGRVSYLELMLTPDSTPEGKVSSEFAERLIWKDGEFGAMRQQLLDGGLREKAAAVVRARLEEAETGASDILKCGTAAAQPGCGVTVRYLFQVARGGARRQVFTQMVTAFEAARADRRVVGLNLVEPEDYPVPRRDFMLHMQMLDFLHGLYPEVHIALHAGELTLGLVPPAELRYHIRTSVLLGHAERIGHGVDVMQEDAPFDLLREMSSRNVMVEICLTSNEVILGVRGAQHPLATYISTGVPVALATDDEGVSRSDMTNEYRKAVEDQGLDYAQLKRMARTSLEHAFIQGGSLWQDARQGFGALVAPCAADTPSAGAPSVNCRQFLADSDKARLQWKLEQDFYEFERQNQ
jgi:adenosine deaminase